MKTAQKKTKRTKVVATRVESAGIVALHVSIKIDVEELREWQPERISALFDGLAKVQAAANQKEAPR